MDGSFSVTSLDLFFMAAGAIGFGMFLLIKGGDAVVNSAIYVSRQLGMPPMLVGFTIIAFGTSLPELLVSMNANLKGFGGISIGNVVGSNIANILLILGVSAILTPLVIQRHAATRDMVIMLLATLALVAAMLSGEIERWMGGLMFAALVGYIVFQYREARQNKEPPPEEVEEADFPNMTACMISLGLGLVGLSLGSEMLVRGTINGAAAIGVPDSVVALTVVAFGTSLPELATCVVAVRRNEHDMIFGNIIGSNVFNILSILGLSALVKPIAVEPHLLGSSLWIMLGTTVVFMVWVLAFHRLQRVAGFVMLGAYLAFVLSEYLLTHAHL